MTQGLKHGKNQLHHVLVGVGAGVVVGREEQQEQGREEQEQEQEGKQLYGHLKDQFPIPQLLVSQQFLPSIAQKCNEEFTPALHAITS